MSADGEPAEDVEFCSPTGRVSGIFRTAAPAGDTDTAPRPVVLHAPGWLGFKARPGYRPLHESWLAAGFGVLTIDYAGLATGSERVSVDPDRQLEDLQAAVSYLTTRPDVDPSGIVCYGGGATGGGNAVRLAAFDPRVRAVACRGPVVDGADWLRRSRSEAEWFAFLQRLEELERDAAGSGEPVWLTAWGELLPPHPSRSAAVAGDVLARQAPLRVPLGDVRRLLRYRPIDVAALVEVPLLVLAVEQDEVVPTSQARALAARAPAAQLVLITGGGHYAAKDAGLESRLRQMITDCYLAAVEAHRSRIVLGGAG